MAQAAHDHHLVVVGGTHITQSDTGMANTALVVYPDGTQLTQDKCHATPWEKQWGLANREVIRIITVSGVRIAILVCYDIEFPELARAVARAGTEVLVVPSWTDDRAGFLRVRRCAQARCIENVCFVIHAPLVGGLDTVDDFEQASGSVGILTPSDVGFPPDGVVVEGGWDRQVTVLADLDFERLRAARLHGTVSPLADARDIASYRIR